MHKVTQWIHSLKDWTMQWAITPGGDLTPWAVWALFINAFAEASFFPVPPDLLLIAMCIAAPKFALIFALICSVGSTIGGMFGYFIGLKGGKPILRKLVKDEKIEQIHKYFEKYEAWAVGIAGFTPIPYKVFSIGAGVFYVDFWKFVLATVISRSARFFIVAGLIMAFGKSIETWIMKNFNLFSILFVVALVGGFYVMSLIKLPENDEKSGAEGGGGSSKPEKRDGNNAQLSGEKAESGENSGDPEATPA